MSNYVGQATEACGKLTEASTKVAEAKRLGDESIAKMAENKDVLAKCIQGNYNTIATGLENLMTEIENVKSSLLSEARAIDARIAREEAERQEQLNQEEM